MRHTGRRAENALREQRDQQAPKEEPATPSTNNSRPMKPLEHLYRWIEVLPNIPGSTTPRVYIRFHCRDLVPTLFQMTASHSLTEPELPVMDHLIVGRTKFEFQPSDSSLTSNFHHVSADSTVRFEDGVACVNVAWFYTRVPKIKRPRSGSGFKFTPCHSPVSTSRSRAFLSYQLPGGLFITGFESGELRCRRFEIWQRGTVQMCYWQEWVGWCPSDYLTVLLNQTQSDAWDFLSFECFINLPSRMPLSLGINMTRFLHGTMG